MRKKNKIQKKRKRSQFEDICVPYKFVLQKLCCSQAASQKGQLLQKVCMSYCLMGFWFLNKKQKKIISVSIIPRRVKGEFQVPPIFFGVLPVGAAACPDQ
jgi:hypothetical protein